ncbi:hypothetical protein PV779_48670 [Streptomyces sp. ID01-9D]|nr:hypothetical protein [Streptomyces sp. ID01-9D]
MVTYHRGPAPRTAAAALSPTGRGGCAVSGRGSDAVVPHGSYTEVSTGG